jgi:prophage regulatory protein
MKPLEDQMKETKTLIRMHTLEGRIDSAASSIYRWVDLGRFPAPIKIGPRAIAWRVEEIEAWEADPEGWAGRRDGQAEASEEGPGGQEAA